MSQTTRLDPTTPEEAFQEEIEDLEKPMLHSVLPWTIAFGALSLLAATLAFFFILSPRQGAYRGPTLGGHPLVSLSEPQGRLSAAPKVFRWEPVQGAAKYIITVTRGDSEVVLLRPVTDIQMVPSGEEVDVFRPGTYTWMVEARGADDNTIAAGETAFVLSGS
jgi:hypothetical protein